MNRDVINYVKKIDLVKLIKFSNKILIEDDILFGVKLKEDTLQFLDLQSSSKAIRNSFFFVSKEISEEIEKLNEQLFISYFYDKELGKDYIEISDNEITIKTELMRSVAFYVGD